MAKTKDLSIVSKGLKYKLRIAFCLMSILPLLSLIYLVSNYIFIRSGVKFDILVFIFIAIVISFIGFLLIREVIHRILAVSQQAKQIASQDIGYNQDSEYADEVNLLSGTLSQLTKHIRNNMQELQGYSLKTAEINLQIQNHVLVFTNLLQISTIISQGGRLEEVLNLITEKSRLLADSDVSYVLFKAETQDLFYVKSASSKSTQYLLKIEVSASDAVFSDIIKTGNTLLLDKEHTLPGPLMQSFYEKFGIKNTLALPVYSKGALIGIMGIGNIKDNFIYSQDEIKLLDVFSKQVAIAIGNDKLSIRLERLEIKDTATGLYNKSYILSRLQEEIRRAIVHQRPCSFVMFDIDNFQAFRNLFVVSEVENRLKIIASLIRDSVGEIDRVARFEDDTFVVVMPEKNKRQALEIAELIRQKIENSFLKEVKEQARLTVSAGVSENPIDGVSPEDLITKAEQLLVLAKEQGKNRVIV